MIYDSIPSKYAKLEKNFGGFIDRYMVRFEFQKVTITYYSLWWHWNLKDLFR